MTFRFGRFRLDASSGHLARGGEAVHLTPKAFALLLFFVRNPGRLLTKDTILDAAWPDVHVTDGALKVVVSELREALGDRADKPRFIETIHRRGYRFLGEVEVGDDDAEASKAARAVLAWRPAATAETTGLPRLIGRERELEILDGWLEAALRGEGRIAFVAGEPGIGKSALLAEFVERAVRRGASASGGQCPESVGGIEAYLPILEALGHLGRGPARTRLVSVLRGSAPTWFAQIPWLLEARDRRALEREILGATRARMMREIAEALERLASETPLVLVLEDLHWSDASTIDLLGFLLARRRSLRALVIGTYRPAELILLKHPLRDLRRELVARRAWEEIVLDTLSEESVATWLGARFPGGPLPSGLAPRVHARTDGNPLFLANVVDDLVSSKAMRLAGGVWKPALPLADIERTIPAGVREMIGRQLERLTARELEVVEAASVAGMDFTLAEVIAAAGGTREEIEDLCASLAKREQLLCVAEGGRYAFAHGLYADVVYERMARSARSRNHLAIGRWLAEDLGAERTAIIAHHLERGGDWTGAIDHRIRTAEIDARRRALREAAENLDRALELTRELAAGAREDAVIRIHETRGRMHRSAAEMSAAAAEFERVASLARARGDRSREVAGLVDLASVLLWIDRPRCAAVVDEIKERAAGLEAGAHRDSLLGLAAVWELDLRGWTSEIRAAAVQSMAAGESVEDPTVRGLHLCWRASLELRRSRYREAVAVAFEGMRLAEEAGDAYVQLNCRTFGAWALFSLGSWREALRVLREGLALAWRNEDGISESAYELLLALVHAEAFDFKGAEALARRALERSRASGFVFGDSLGTFLLGVTDFGLGRFADGRRRIEELVAAEEASLQWIVHVPLNHILAELDRAMGDLDASRRAGERLVEPGSGPGKRTWIALGRTSLAETAAAAGDPDRQAEEVAGALAAIEGIDVPLAAWRVHAAAARMLEARGREDLAETHRRRSRAILDTLADELTEEPELRRSLVESPIPARLGVPPMRVVGS